MKPWAKKILGGVVVVAVVIQFINRPGNNPPVAPGHDLLAGTNPPPRVARLLREACYDCHSYETDWRWYGNFAPVSWWLAGHVGDARAALNFSEWPHDNSSRAAKKWSNISEVVGNGDMPLRSYTWMHAASRLTPEQRKTLTDWADAEAERLKNIP